MSGYGLRRRAKLSLISCDRIQFSEIYLYTSLFTRQAQSIIFCLANMSLAMIECGRIVLVRPLRRQSVLGAKGRRIDTCPYRLYYSKGCGSAACSGLHYLVQICDAYRHVTTHTAPLDVISCCPNPYAVEHQDLARSTRGNLQQGRSPMPEPRIRVGAP